MISIRDWAITIIFGAISGSVAYRGDLVSLALSIFGIAVVLAPPVPGGQHGS